MGRLYLYIGTMGYQARLVDDQGQTIAAPITVDLSLIQESSPQIRLEKILRQAISDLGRGLLRTADTIVLLINSDRIVYVGNQHEALRAASDASARLFGQHLLNANSPQAVTFGFAGFERCGKAAIVPEVPRAFDQETATDSVRSRGGVYAFAEVAFIRSLLALFDQAGPKIIGLIPLPYLLLHKASQHPTQTYGALHFGAHHSVIVVANCQINGLIVRYAPVGSLILGQALSAKAGTSLKSALEVLKTRELLSRAGEEGLEPALTQLVQTLRETIDYFAGQRAGGKPHAMEIFGPFDTVRGLSEWLSREVGLPMTAGSPAAMDLLIQPQIDPMEACNLLRGAGVSLLSVGKIPYTYTKMGFTKAEAKEKSASLHTKPILRGVSRRRIAEPHRRGGFLAAFFNRMMAKLKPVAQGDSADHGDADGHARRQGAMVLAALLILILWAYDQYSTLRLRYQGMVEAYGQALSLNRKNLQDAQSLKTNLSGQDHSAADKIFWTESFLAISKAINQDLWLTDVSLSDSQPTTGKTADKKLTLQGEVLPSSSGHLLHIADFIRGLEEVTRHDFKRNLPRITLNMVSLNPAENVVHFSLDVLYDRERPMDSRAKGDGS